jgi:hypothetical protein
MLQPGRPWSPWAQKREGFIGPKPWKIPREGAGVVPLKPPAY